MALGGWFWQDRIHKIYRTHIINTILHTYLSQRWTQIQEQLYPRLSADLESTSPKLEKLIHVLEWIDLDKKLPYIG